MTWPAYLPLGAALLVNLLLTPLIRRLGISLGRVAMPREDRWHTDPTPTLGGVGIVLSFALALALGLFFFHAEVPGRWGFLSGSLLVFLVGLYDEFRPMTPIAKLVSQILAATLVIALGTTSTFFSPRISNEILAMLPNILFTYVWLVGITNSINLLDNMDGLAGGISLIAAAVLGYFFWSDGDLVLLWVALALVGSLLGFLAFNFPPARIFMGDSGSQFLGFTLAGLAIAQQQQASNVLAVVGVPTLIFLLPILDTALVTVTRLMGGQSPVQGGRDHTSHRLVAFGLSQRQALFVLYGVALFSAVMAALLESLNYWLSLVLVPIAILSLALLAAYLGRLKVVSTGAASRQGLTISRVMLDLTYRRRLLEVLLDFFLIGITYYLAFLVQGRMTMSPARLELFLDSLPVALACTYLALYAFGIYRVMWRYTGFDDLFHYLQASLGSLVLMAASIFVLQSTSLATWPDEFGHAVLLVYGVFLFIGLALSRSSFRLMDTLLRQRVRSNQTPILIVGAGDAGEMALRWILMNPDLNYRPVGFIASDPLLVGRDIHGIKVLGVMETLPKVLERHAVAGLILADSGMEAEGERLLAAAGLGGKCWVRRLRLEFEPIDLQE